MDEVVTFGKRVRNNRESESSVNDVQISPTIGNTKFRVQDLVDIALLTSNVSQLRVQWLCLQEDAKDIREGKVIENAWVTKFILALICISLGLHILIGFVMVIQREVHREVATSASPRKPEPLYLKLFISCGYFIIIIINVVINILIQ